MSKSTPFVCRWAGAHSKPLYFDTQVNLETHVYNDHVKSTNLAYFVQGKLIYSCPWGDCKEQLSNNTKFEEHLWNHTTQKPFKCPICDNSCRYRTSDELYHHLIFRHNDRVMDYTGTNDMTNHEDGDASEDEDYNNYLKKRDDKSDYGKSEDDIIWEGLCSAIDSEIVDEVVTRLKAFKERA
ncbi:zinc finger protein 169 [Rhizophagus clarus]|uniref:Zinc finger protein 169 n=1 Tax=Rhizophagus clarus TaxID=94130 RepID=A0A8H3R453_9GLOM|nr:zinc finger protein 169 [Rhizophagus clarus]